MPTNCFFKFTRETPIYYSGEEICGSVSFVTSKRIKIELLALNLTGCYRVQWNEKSQESILEHCDDPENDHMINYNTSKLFLNESMKLLEKSELKPGAHVYDLRFTLPQNCPPTMEQDLGEVAYNIQLMLHRPAKYSKTYKQRFIIKPFLDLNDITASPFNEKILLEGHPFHIYLPQTTYVPGQAISYAFKNASLPVTVNRIKLSLLQNITFKSFQPSVNNKQVSKLIATNYWKINTAQPYLVLPLTIPTTTLNTDWPIQVSYYMEFSLVNHNNKIFIKVIKPIIIGTISLKNAKNYYAINELWTPYCFDNLGSSVLDTENIIKNNVRQKHDKINYSMHTSYMNNQIDNCERISLLS